MNNYLHIYKDEFGNKVFRYHFPSITSLVEYLRTAPVNYKNFTRLASETPDNSRSNIHRGESLEDTLNHLIYGYSDTYSEYREKSRIDRIHIETPMDYSRVRAVRSYVGSRVDIEAYVNGLEKNMLRPVRAVSKNIITFNYDLGNKGYVPENQIINRGMIAMLIIKALEQNNFSVNLNSYILHKNRQYDKEGREERYIAYEEGELEVLYVTLNLKDADLPLNEAKCVGPFMRPEFQRRGISRLTETTPGLNKYWYTNRYGYLLPEKERDLVFKTRPGDITFGNTVEMGIKGEDLEKDLESAIKYLHLDDIITLKKRLH